MSDPTHWTAFQRIQNVINRVTYPGVTFELQARNGYDRPSATFHVRVSCPDGKCNVTGAPMPWNGRWHRLSRHMTDGEIAQTCFLAVILANEHEARESFKVDGVPVFQPHFDLDALVAFARDAGNTKERDEAKPPVNRYCEICEDPGDCRYCSLAGTAGPDFAPTAFTQAG